MHGKEHFCHSHISIFFKFMTSQGASWMPGFRMNADWEKAERNAWRNVFGDVPLDGCLFHFGT